MVLWEVWSSTYGFIYSALDKSNYKDLIIKDDDISVDEEDDWIIEQLCMI